MASPDVTEAKVLEEAQRVLHSLIDERRQLRERSDSDPLAEANRLAIQYWRGVIEEKLRHANRRPDPSSTRDGA